MIIWLNGAFGAGKTTTANQLAGRLANARHFDPELVGYLLMTALSDHEYKDFQDLRPWRELVPVFTEKIASLTGSTSSQCRRSCARTTGANWPAGSVEPPWPSSTSSCTSIRMS